MVRQFEQPNAGTLFGGGGPPQVNMMNMGGVNPLMAMMLQLGAQQVAGPAGIVPLQFHPQASTFDQLQALELQAQNQAAIQQTVSIDQQSIERLSERFQMLMGEDAETREARARVHGEDFGMIGPLLAQFAPRETSMMMGARGSAMVASQQMMLAGRHMVDPTTGELGFSGETAAEFAKIATEQLYGTHEAEAAMKGIPVDRMAEILAVSARRGMGPASITTDEDAMAAFKMFETGRVTDEGIEGARAMDLDEADIEALEQGGQAAEAVVRKFDAQKTARWMQEMAGAVRAMEDIFGPGMPGDQLITAMMQLTQKNAGGMTPAQLEMSIRTTKQLAEASDLGIGGMMQLQAAAGQIGDQMNLGRENAVTAAQHAAAFSMAFDEQGLGELGFDKDRFTAADLQLTQQAGAAPVTEQLAATVRLGEMAPFEAGSRAEALFQALQEGKDTWVDPLDGAEREVYVPEQEWQEIMASSGVDTQVAQQVRMQQGLNRELAEERGLDEITRGLQFELDVAPRLAQAAADSVFSQMHNRGIELDREQSSRIGRQVVEGLRELPMEDLVDPETRRQAVTTELREAFAAEGIDTADISDEQMNRMAGALVGEMDEMVRGERGMGHADLAEAFALHDEGMIGDTRRRIGKERLDARLESTLSGLGRTDFGRRLFDTIMNATEDDTIETVIGKVFGGVEQSEMVDELTPLFEDLTRQKEELQAIISDPENFNPETGRLKVEQQEQVDQMLTQINELVKGSDVTGGIAEQLIGLQGHEGDHAFTDFLTDTETGPVALTDEQRGQAGQMLQSAARELQARGREGMVERMAERMGVSTEELLGDEPLAAAAVTDEIVERETRLLAARKTGLGAVRRMAEEEWIKLQAQEPDPDQAMEDMLEEGGVPPLPPEEPPAEGNGGAAPPSARDLAIKAGLEDSPIAMGLTMPEGPSEEDLAEGMAADPGPEPPVGPQHNLDNQYAAEEAAKGATPDERDRAEDLTGGEQTIKIAGTLEIPGLGEGHIKATSGQTGFLPVT